MSKFVLLVAIAVTTLGFAGCTKETANTTTANKTEVAANKTTTTPANSAPANTATANTATANTEKPADTKTTKTETAAADKIGVPECDDYLAKYEACLFNKVPEAYRATYKTSFEQMRTSWKQTAANPQAKAALANGCKQALETAKQSFASYSCEW